MSFFNVTIEEIHNLRKHPNADRLDLANLAGKDFQFVMGKDQYKNGDKVLYFPIDSLIPDEIQEKLGIQGMLSGKKKDRVKTIKLRGEVSQGVVGPISLVSDLKDNPNPEKITEFLGVIKYEPPVIPFKFGKLARLPMGLSKYDIEGAQNFQNVIEFLMDQPVHISEKLEGQNFAVAHSALDLKIYVNQRNFTILPTENKKEHVFWTVARDYGWIDLVNKLSEDGKRNVVIYGEFIGPAVQANIYKLKQHCVKAFDIMINGDFLSPDQFLDELSVFFGDKYQDLIVPELCRNTILYDWLGNNTVDQASEGESALYPTLREGVVIRPMKEQYHNDIGRLIVKHRSTKYLANSKI